MAGRLVGQTRKVDTGDVMKGVMVSGMFRDCRGVGREAVEEEVCMGRGGLSTCLDIPNVGESVLSIRLSPQE